jgi:chromosome segregation ATPase
LTAYESELSRLKVISARLQAISVQLDLKLSESEKSLQALSNELETLRIELQGLKNQLETSSQGSAQLGETLAKSEALLARLTASFQEYKDAAETKIKRLDRKVKALTVIASILVVGAASGWTAWAVK